MAYGSVGGGKQESSSQSTSRPTTPEELQAYFNNLNSISGDKLGSWAQTGTAQSHYDPLSQAQLEAIGGAGATRQAEVDLALANQQEKIAANSAMTYAQQQQANQNAFESAMTQKDAINKEVEAAMTGLASQEAMRAYQANLANAKLTSQDLALLSQIYFGGKGQHSQSTSDSSGWNFSTSGGFGSKGG